METSPKRCYPQSGIEFLCVLLFASDATSSVFTPEKLQIQKQEKENINFKLTGDK